uniref:SGNH domain-containing protein n=2 Tax=Caenorhabditis tropicalis TaxID=1561998 RepID=A0A1I7T0N4_9PELO
MLPFSWNHDPMSGECQQELNAGMMPGGDPFDQFGYGHCPNGNGTSSIMIVGNSYCRSFRDPFRAAFKNNFSEFRFVSLADGFGIYADGAYSKLSLNETRRQVEKYKPDVLLIVARYTGAIKTPMKEEKDEWLNEMNENIEWYEKYSKKIYILDSHPLYSINFLNHFLQYSLNRLDDIDSLHLNRREADREMKYAKRRFEMVKCSKCHFFDLSHLFIDGDKYLTFDPQRMISYVDNSIHLSNAAIDFCRPELERIAHEIMNSL